MYEFEVNVADLEICYNSKSEYTLQLLHKCGASILIGFVIFILIIAILEKSVRLGGDRIPLGWPPNTTITNCSRIQINVADLEFYYNSKSEYTLQLLHKCGASILIGLNVFILIITIVENSMWVGEGT